MRRRGCGGEERRKNKDERGRRRRAEGARRHPFNPAETLLCSGSASAPQSKASVSVAVASNQSRVLDSFLLRAPLVAAGPDRT